MQVETELDFCARRAAEEFLAAGRAPTAAERMAHRQLAEKYAMMVREIIDNTGGIAARLIADDEADDARAA